MGLIQAVGDLEAAAALPCVRETMTFPKAPLVCHNGRLVPGAEAQVSVFHPALYGAYGVYESIEVRAGVAFHLDDHLARLAASAAFLEMALPASPRAMTQWIIALLRAVQSDNCLLRLFVLGANGSSPAEAFIWPQALPVYPALLYEQGAGAVTYEGERALPQAKSLNTLVSFLARRKAQHAGEHEGLLVSRGTVKEGSSSNLFVVRDGRILVPPPHEVLAGVTADVVVALAQENGIPIAVQDLPVNEIGQWDEAFLTSTSRHVMPLVRIDGQPLGHGRPGPVTQRLAALFEENFGTSHDRHGA